MCKVKRIRPVFVPDTRLTFPFRIMADMGYRLLQTVTSTLCEQCGPAIGEPQAAPATNPHFQFGAHMGGGTLHWQAAGNGGPLTVMSLPGSSSSFTSPPPVAPSPLSLPPIEDRSEAPSLPAPITSPFPGPIIPGKGLGKASPVVPDQSPELAPPVSTTLPDESSHQDGALLDSPRWPPVWKN